MVADPEQEVRSLAKKVLWILFAVVLVLALAVAGVTGYFWYQNNHIFVEDAVYPINAKTLDLRGQDISFEHYDAVHSQLPNCEIYWDVPFQVGKYPNDTTKLTVADLTEKDIRILLNYFPKLKTLDATACSDYAVLESAKQQLPGCEILYEVNLGGKSFAPEVTELTLEVGDYDYDTLMENLQYLPDVQQITLKKPELTLEQIDELKTTFGNITIDCTVDIGGTEYTMDTTELNLSGISSGDVAGISEKLAMLPGLTSVELMKSDGTSSLTKDDVKTLKEAAPEATFHYVFDFYGETLTEKQRELFDLYYNEDLSLSEIAEHAGITRQGVRDSIKRAEHALHEMEDKLGLVARYGDTERCAEELQHEVEQLHELNAAQLHSAEADEIVSRMTALLEQLRQEA